MEGIFRLSGSEKRIKELKASFDSPDRYGKGLDWTGYTVHDAANILRRYFNQLPEPIVPLEFYENFRDPLRNHQAQAVGAMDLQAPSEGDFDLDNAIKTYQTLITCLPPLNRQLLLYILDLLAVFASKSDLNKMNTPNLSAIFQPGILSHPSHDMSPPDYRLSQDVLIFLIENQDHFLIGMQGTEADEKTVQEVQRGSPQIQSQPRTPPTTTTSAGAESVRLFGGVRRNVSVSSRHSKSSIGSPDATGIAAGAGVGGSVSGGVGGGVSPRLFQHAPGSPSSSSVHRSNTLPAKRSPGVPSAKFPREKISSPTTPNSTVVEEEFSPTEDAGESVGRLNGTTGLSDRAAGAEPVQVARQERASATSHLQQLETIPQNPSSEDVNNDPAGKEFNTRLAAVIAPTSATNTVPAENHIKPSSSTTQESNTNVTPTDLTTEPTTLSSNAATTTTQPTTPSSEAPQSAVSTGATSSKAFSAMFTRSPPSDSEQKKDGRRPNKLQKKRNAGSSVNPSARSSTQSLSEQGQGTTKTTTTTLVAMGPESANSEVDSQQQRTRLVGGGETSTGNRGNVNLQPDASPSPSFHSRSSVTDVTDTDMATGDEDAGDGGGGTARKIPATGVGSGKGGAKSSSSASSPPREKERKRWRFSSRASSSNKHDSHSYSKNNNNDNNSGNVSSVGNAGDSQSASHESGSIRDGSGAGGSTGAGVDEQSFTGPAATVRQSRKGSTSPSHVQQRQEQTPVVTEEQQQQYQKMLEQQQQQQQHKGSDHSKPAKDSLTNSSSDKDSGRDASGDANHQHHRSRKSSSALDWFKGKLSDRRAEKHFNRTKSPPPPHAQPSQTPSTLPGSGMQASGKGSVAGAGTGTVRNINTGASTGTGTASALSPSSATTTQTMVTALSSPTSTMNTDGGGSAATPTTTTTGGNTARLATDATLGESKDNRSKRALSQQGLDMKSPNLGVPARGGGGGGEAERKARSMDVPR